MMTPEDADRMAFLRKLDNAPRIEVSEWEATFIGDFLQNPRGMTAAQRAAVDAMRDQYEGKF